MYSSEVAEDKDTLYQLEEKWQKNYQEKNILIEQLERELSSTVDELVRTREQGAVQVPNPYDDLTAYQSSFRQSMPMAPAPVIHSIHSSPPRNYGIPGIPAHLRSPGGVNPSLSSDPLRRSQEFSNSSAVILNEENKRLKGSIEMFTNQVARLQADIKFMKTSLDDSQGKLAYRQQQIMEYEVNIQRRILTEGDLKQQIAALQTSLDLKADENLRLQTELCEHNKQSLVLLQRLDNLESSSNQQQYHDLLIKSYDDVKRIEQMDKKMVELSKENAALQEQCSALLGANKEKKRTATPPRAASPAPASAASPKRGTTVGSPSALKRTATMGGASAGYVSKPVAKASPKAPPVSSPVATPKKSPLARSSTMSTQRSPASVSKLGSFSPSPAATATSTNTSSTRDRDRLTVDITALPPPDAPAPATPAPTPVVEAPQRTFLEIGDSPGPAPTAPAPESEKPPAKPKPSLTRSSTMSAAPAKKSTLARTNTMSVPPASSAAPAKKSTLSRSSTMSGSVSASTVAAPAPAKKAALTRLGSMASKPSSAAVVKGSSFRRESSKEIAPTSSTLGKKVTVVIPSPTVEIEAKAAAAAYASVDDSFDDIPMVEEMHDRDDDDDDDDAIDGVADASFSSVTVANTLANTDPSSLPADAGSPLGLSESPKGVSMLTLRRQQEQVGAVGTDVGVSHSIELLVPQIEPMMVSSEETPAVDTVAGGTRLSSSMASVLKKKAEKAKAVVATKAVPEQPVATKKPGIPSAKANWKKAVSAVKKQGTQ